MSAQGASGWFKIFGYKQIVSGSHYSIASFYRIKRTEGAVKMFKDHPFFGLGFHHFRKRFDEYFSKDFLRWTSYENKIPDSMYLTLLSESGLTGLGGFLVFILALLKRSYLRLRTLQNEKKEALFVGCLSFFGILINMAGYDLFYWQGPCLLFFLICGFMQSKDFSIENSL
jgi:O-antigen ligase